MYASIIEMLQSLLKFQGRLFNKGRLKTWLQNDVQVSGEVMAVNTEYGPKIFDYYKVFSFLMLFCLCGIFMLQVLIPFLVLGLIFWLIITAFMGRGGGRGFPWMTFLLMRQMGQRGQVPRLSMRLRDDQGNALDVVAPGQQNWPAPALGDELDIKGRQQGGIIQLTGGLNKTTGAQLTVTAINWRAVFIVLLICFVIGLLVLGGSALGAPAR